MAQAGRNLQKKGVPIIKLKDEFVFQAMIRQPDFLSDEIFQTFVDATYTKTKNKEVLNARLKTIDEGLVCQMLHIGSYDSEPESFMLMESTCLQTGYQRIKKQHREIYLSDPRKVKIDNLKTVLRFQIEKQ